jgi:hypothetical protein
MTGATLETTKITMAISRTEDRISLTCALPGDERAVLWLTARLARQLIPHLMKELARSPEAPRFDDEQEMPAAAGQDAQEAAVTAGPNSSSWLVTAIDIHPGPPIVRLCFRQDHNHPAVLLGLEYKELSRWLAGLKRCYIQADWPMDCWQPHNHSGLEIQSGPEVTLH